MKNETKKWIITIINIVIFIGNAIISSLSNGGDVSTFATVASVGMSIVSMI